MWSRVVKVLQDIQEGDEQDRVRRRQAPPGDHDTVLAIELMVADVTMFNEIPNPSSVLPHVVLPEEETEKWSTQVKVFYQDGKVMPLDTGPGKIIVTHCELILDQCNTQNAIILAKLGEHPAKQIRIREGPECSRPLVLGTRSAESIENILSARNHDTPLIHHRSDQNVFWNRTLRGLLTLIQYSHVSEERDAIYRAIVDHCSTDYIIPVSLSVKIEEWDRCKRTPVDLGNCLSIEGSEGLSFSGVLLVEFIPKPEFSEVAIGDV